MEEYMNKKNLDNSYYLEILENNSENINQNVTNINNLKLHKLNSKQNFLLKIDF